MAWLARVERKTFFFLSDAYCLVACDDIILLSCRRMIFFYMSPFSCLGFVFVCDFSLLSSVYFYFLMFAAISRWSTTDTCSEPVYEGYAFFFFWERKLDH